MSHKTAIRIYEIASYVLIMAATAVYFMVKNQGKLSLTMTIVALALCARWMMERHRCKAADEENDQLKADLRRLTQLLAEEKKKNNQTIKQ